MSRNVAKRAAREIAGQIITAARTSGSDPIAWVTGNAMMPPLRWFDAAERIWQLPAAADMQPWESLVERVEDLLSSANVAMECPDYDNALYAVDLARFEYAESESGDMLQNDWRPFTPAA
jgi:hypothetical protein